MTQTTDSAIDAARAAYDEATARVLSLDASARADREALETIGRDIAAALADGNSAKADKLRAQRSATEERARDYASAQAVASLRVENADRALARLEVVALAADVREKARQFVQLTASANVLSTNLQAALNRLRSRYSAADMADSPYHPKEAISALTPLASRFFHWIKDVAP